VQETRYRTRRRIEEERRWHECLGSWSPTWVSSGKWRRLLTGGDGSVEDQGTAERSWVDVYCAARQEWGEVTRVPTAVSLSVDQDPMPPHDDRRDLDESVQLGWRRYKHHKTLAWQGLDSGGGGMSRIGS
jgi:hypothetical protein